VLRCPLLRGLLPFIWILGHDVLKVTPQRLDGRKFVADLSDFLERSIQLVDVLENHFEGLRQVLASVQQDSSGTCHTYLCNLRHQHFPLLLEIRLFRRARSAIRRRSAICRHVDLSRLVCRSVALRGALGAGWSRTTS
jgi:hypothetical protein